MHRSEQRALLYPGQQQSQAVKKEQLLNPRQESDCIHPTATGRYLPRPLLLNPSNHSPPPKKSVIFHR